MPLLSVAVLIISINIQIY